MSFGTIGGQTRRASAAVSRRKKESNGDFCDEIRVPGEQCLGQETAAITGERKEGRKEEKKRQQAALPQVPTLKFVFC